MAISTYLELKSAIQSWAKRSDISSYIDDFIDLAEADMWGGPSVTNPEILSSEPLRIREMEARATAETSTSDRFLELPEGYLQMRKLRIINGSVNQELMFRVPESITVLASAGIPTEYSITSEIQFNRVCGGLFTAEMNYYKSLTPLSQSNTSNAVLARYPNIYLYGALSHFSDWAMNDGLKLKYEKLFVSAIRAANKNDRKGRYGSGKSMKREGPTP